MPLDPEVPVVAENNHVPGNPGLPPPPPPEEEEEDDDETETPASSSRVPYVVGVVILTAYAIFVALMARRVGTEEPDWSRLLYLFTGVEALAFAAAGFLFGREVNRGRAQAAEGRAKAEAKRAKAEAERARGAEHEAAAKRAQGQTLVRTLDSMASAADDEGWTLKARDLDERGGSPGAGQARQLRQIADLGRGWFFDG